MANIKLKGQTINPGKTEGEAVVIKTRFGWIGDIDALTGRYCAAGVEGELLSDKILVFPGGRGSAYSPGVAYTIKKRGKAPRAMICMEADPLTAVSAITADIAMIHRFDRDPMEVIKSGDYLKVDATAGTVEVISQP